MQGSSEATAILIAELTSHDIGIISSLANIAPLQRTSAVCRTAYACLSSCADPVPTHHLALLLLTSLASGTSLARYATCTTSCVACAVCTEPGATASAAIAAVNGACTSRLTIIAHSVAALQMAFACFAILSWFARTASRPTLVIPAFPPLALWNANAVAILTLPLGSFSANNAIAHRCVQALAGWPTGILSTIVAIIAIFRLPDANAIYAGVPLGTRNSIVTDIFRCHVHAAQASLAVVRCADIVIVAGQ